MLDKRFCKRIRKERKKRRWTQRQLGVALGIARSYVSMLENGTKVPSRTQILALSNLFDCTVLELDPHFDFEINKGNLQDL